MANIAKRLQLARRARLKVRKFMIHTTQQAADKVFHKHGLLLLTRKEQIAFVSVLLNPPAPGIRLRQAAEGYRRKSGL